MKKTLFALTSLAALAIAMVSCMKESNAPALKVNEKGIKVNIISDMDSKTYVQDGDIPAVYWSEGDYVTLFETVDGKFNDYDYSEDAVIDGRKASFSAVLTSDDPVGSSYKYTAVYPGSAIYPPDYTFDGDGDGENDWIIYLREEQNLVNGNMALNSDILISDPYDNGADRVADDDNLLFTFHRLGTVVRLQLKGITAGEIIKKITITAPTYIAGYFKFDTNTCTVSSDYYVWATNEITLNTSITASGDDVVWFRVFSPEDWEAFSIEVTTDAAKYTRDYIDASANPLKFINEGLTKFAVNLADYRVEKEPESIPYYEGFEDAANLEDWTFLDADGDGYKWYQNTGSAAYSGQSYLCSDSWNGQAGVLTPDNWAFTPAIQLTEGNYVGFWVSANPSYPDEHYGVYITLDNPAGGLPGSVTRLFEDTIGSGEIEPTETKTASGYTFYHFYVQIPASFDGKIAYIGFRHFDCSDNYYLNLDEVSVTETIPEPEPDPVWLEDFENEETLADWTLIDADGDGFQWGAHINTGSGNHSTHSGDGVLISASYDLTAGALTPDNWAFTPGITLTEGNYLSFWICAQDPDYADEHYAVYITDQAPSADNLSGCTVLKTESVSTGSYERFIIAIPESFANKTAYIGFRHFNCSDMFILNLDDVAIYDKDPTGGSSSASTSSVSPSSAPRSAFAKGGKKMASSDLKKNTGLIRKNK